MTSIREMMKSGEAKAGLLFILPFLLGFIIFNLFPLIYAFYISMVDYNTLKPSYNFIGFDNFVRIFNDNIAIKAYWNSFLYTLVYVPVLIVLSFFLAMLLNRKFFLRPVSRTMILIPYVANVVAIAMVFSVILDPYDGPVNAFLQMIGIETPPMWLAGIGTALPTIALINVWQSLSFQTIVYLAALQGVPNELYEAADLDGAGKWRKMLNVTLPIVSPTTFFLVITSIIGSFQNYASVRALTNGGPGVASRVISLNIYEEAFTYNRYSYAAAQAILLFAVILVITIIQWKGQKRWVHN
ncbi:MAG: sugar ABC transporter permease [Candidatus Pristimantibacillus lignocellulolyticus]|uniref:Sugar ABC transporter permease n=1 Tax=Candidatus Pristimantibacillus lignocellulolyticus TaxID=2994561 RepID=A0A9J6ZL52_9BACL|nr:MAG: sugar ABC transporter permease [Candidatus Pristimantibacillus lignocellulolyticus]